MSSRPSHASGIIIISACGSDAAGEHEQLEHVVEDRASREPPVVDDRDDVLEVVAEGLARAGATRARASS